jgi:hypothetical protein
MSDRTITVFTFRPVSTMLQQGGSEAWALKPANARRCKYVVCTRNRFHDGAGPEPHGTAFLVGKISSVEPSPLRSDRFIIRFDEYALVKSEKVVWPGARNPVWYVDDIRDLEINPDALEWQPMPEGNSDESDFADDEVEAAAGMTFSQARAAIALRYGVPPEDVEIIIRG